MYSFVLTDRASPGKKCRRAGLFIYDPPRTRLPSGLFWEEVQGHAGFIMTPHGEIDTIYLQNTTPIIC